MSIPPIDTPNFYSKRSTQPFDTELFIPIQTIVVQQMLRHQYPTQPHTSRMVNRVHGGRGMRMGHAQGRLDKTTKGFTHVRSKGPPPKGATFNTLKRHPVPHHLNHKTPDVLLKVHHSTWGGPRDVTANLHKPASDNHKPMSKDGHFLHKTKSTNHGQKMSIHGSVDYDFLRPK